MRVKTAGDIGALIRSARKRAGWKQSELAQRIGAGTRWVSLMENGSTTAELGRVLRAVQALGIELDAIVPGESAKPTAADVSGTSTGADDLDAIVRAHTPRTAR